MQHGVIVRPKKISRKNAWMGYQSRNFRNLETGQKSAVSTASCGIERIVHLEKCSVNAQFSTIQRT